MIEAVERRQHLIAVIGTPFGRPFVLVGAPAPAVVAHGIEHLVERRIAAVDVLPDLLRIGPVAEILDVPVTTVQIRLVRARRMIYNDVTNKDRKKVWGK